MSMSMSMSMASMTNMASATGTSAAAAATTSAAMDMDMGMGGSCKISMLWNWYTIDACFLASSWHVTSAGMFAASCIGVAFLVVSMELLRRLGKEYDAFILRQFQRHIASSRSADLKPNNNGSGPSPNSCQRQAEIEPSFVTFRASPLQQLIRSAIHAATFGVAYIVMLLAMYFNGYIIISIIIGSFIGKFLCDWLVVKMQVGGGGQNRGTDNVVEEATVCCG